MPYCVAAGRRPELDGGGRAWGSGVAGVAAGVRRCDWRFGHTYIVVKSEFDTRSGGAARARTSETFLSAVFVWVVLWPGLWPPSVVRGALLTGFREGWCAFLGGDGRPVSFRWHASDCIYRPPS